MTNKSDGKMSQCGLKYFIFLLVKYKNKIINFEKCHSAPQSVVICDTLSKKFATELTLSPFIRVKVDIESIQLLDFKLNMFGSTT